MIPYTSPTEQYSVNGIDLSSAEIYVTYRQGDVTAAGNVTLYNRSGSALGTNTNLYGNATWVI